MSITIISNSKFPNYETLLLSHLYGYFKKNNVEINLIMCEDILNFYEIEKSPFENNNNLKKVIRFYSRKSLFQFFIKYNNVSTTYFLYKEKSFFMKIFRILPKFYSLRIKKDMTCNRLIYNDYKITFPTSKIYKRNRINSKYIYQDSEMDPNIYRIYPRKIDNYITKEIADFVTDNG